jgi:CRISPR-associated protein Csd2
MKNAIDKRYEFVMFFDVENGNPNGDPDAGNMPRIDAETSHGIVTDVCLKRKVRNFVELSKNDSAGYRIFMKEGSVLNDTQKEAYIYHKIESVAKKLPSKEDESSKITGFMCENFYDIRSFGAVMTTEVNCGQVRGPVQFTFARSLDPIVQQEVTITRMAVTNAKDADKERTMGRKHIVPYGLYRVEGFISAPLAEKTGFGEDDLELLWQSLTNLFEYDRSAARGKMATRKLIIFEHSCKLGNAPAHKLFELITSERVDSSKPPRAFSDYKINVKRDNLPEGITVVERV